MPKSQTGAPMRDHAKISLVVATLGRREELTRLLDSLSLQALAPHEIIIVDQNPKGWLAATIAPFAVRLPLFHLSCAKGASHARNIGLIAATGDWVGFPDDDCWASPDWLANLAPYLNDAHAPGALCVPLDDEHGHPLMLRWPRRRTAITRENVWQTCLMAGFFARRELLHQSTGFDERLGVGATSGIGSGEETDLALRLLASGAKLEFHPCAGLSHPARPPLAKLTARAESYGRGFGYVWTRHRLSAAGFYYYCLRAFGGWMRAKIRGDQGAAAFYSASLAGRRAGRALALSERSS